MNEELIEQLKNGIEVSIERGENQDSRSWEGRDGVIITRTQAELFLKLLQQPTPEQVRRKAFDEIGGWLTIDYDRVALNITDFKPKQ